jgi:hypothetical protein
VNRGSKSWRDSGSSRGQSGRNAIRHGPSVRNRLTRNRPVLDPRTRQKGRFCMTSTVAMLCSGMHGGRFRRPFQAHRVDSGTPEKGNDIRSKKTLLTLSPCLGRGHSAGTASSAAESKFRRQPLHWAETPRRSKRSVSGPAQAAARVASSGCQFQGRSSAMRRAGWPAMRASTSAR